LAASPPRGDQDAAVQPELREPQSEGIQKTDDQDDREDDDICCRIKRCEEGGHIVS